MTNVGLIFGEKTPVLVSKEVECQKKKINTNERTTESKKE